jgi:WD40 repeat protein
MTIDARGTKLAVKVKDKIEIWAIDGSERTAIDYPSAETATVGISDDGSTLALCDDKGAISAWTISAARSTGRVMNSDAQSSRLEFTRDNSRVISYSDDVLSVWNVAAGDLVFSKKSPILDFALHPKIDELAAITRDGSIVVWSIVNGQEQMRLPASSITGNRGLLTLILYTFDGDRLIAGYGDNSFNVISLDEDLLKERACTAANRPLTRSEAELLRVFEDHTWWEAPISYYVGCPERKP